MNKKFRLFTVAIIAALLIVLILPSAALAADKERIVDYIGVLSDSQLVELNDYVREISRKYHFDVAFFLSSNAYASDQTLEGYAKECYMQMPTDERPPRFIDKEGLLTLEQADTLKNQLDEISERHQFDVVVAVVSSLNGREASLYAADFFDRNGFGYGENLDGAILLIATENRDFGFAALGFGIKAFTPAEQEYLDKLFVPYLKNNQYYDAFMAYADAADAILTRTAAGLPYDEGNIPTLPSETVKYRLYGVGIGLLLALIIATMVTSGWKRQLISVRKENFAHAYIRENSMVLTGRRDIFLYRHVQKVQRVHNNSGGGTATNSSGRAFSGHSGKY
ncbi:MAG: TPM domain-containing protein [Clostridiales bacterium]|jgi:uncharacterized protein|nr:TPM domain-containing protein [Clostridiales bacterium]